MENFYLLEKENKEKSVKKFVDSKFVKTCDELVHSVKLATQRSDCFRKSLAKSSKLATTADQP